MKPYTVIVRSTPACNFCQAAEKLLEDKGIPYKTIDIAAHPAAKEIYLILGNTTVPLIIDGNGRDIGGYDALVAELDPMADWVRDLAERASDTVPIAGLSEDDI